MATLRADALVIIAIMHACSWHGPHIQNQRQADTTDINYMISLIATFHFSLEYFVVD